jgi:hypothetical protein
MVYNHSFSLIKYHEIHARTEFFVAACAQRLPNLAQMRAFWTGSDGPKELEVARVTAVPVYAIVVESCFARICQKAATKIGPGYAKKKPPSYEQLQTNLIKWITFFLNVQVPGIEQEGRVEIVLTAFFRRFLKDYTHSQSIDLSALLDPLQLSRVDRRRLLTALLYQIYFKDFFRTEYTNGSGGDKWVIFTSFLTKVIFDLHPLPKFSWEGWLDCLDNPTLLATVLFEIHEHIVVYREASRSYFSQLEEKLKQKGSSPKPQQLLQLVKSLRRRSTIVDAEWASFLRSTINQPAARSFERMEALIKGQLDRHAATLCRLLGTAPLIASLGLKLEGGDEARWILVRERYQKRAFTEKELRSFLSLFGLSYEYSGSDSLIDVIEKSLKQRKFDHLLPLLELLYDLLEAFIDRPSTFSDALGSVTYALPTCNKDLSHLAWLPSLVDAFAALREHINPPVTPHLLRSEFSRYPIFIFDQSDDSLYAKNHRFIEMLCKSRDVTIIHLSKREILDVAAKLKVERWINTTGRGEFGYGGARNAVYLLTPVLREAVRRGAIADARADDLRALFKKHVLENGSIVHMGDDDGELPETTFFTDLLFAAQHKGEYFKRLGTFYGRATNRIAGNPVSLELVFAAPREAYQTTVWTDSLAFAGMMSSISSPRFCLNLPFGCEEGQDVPFKKEYVHGLTAPTIHLAGSRFPTKELPLHPLTGLRGHLQKFIPYSLQLALVKTLLVPDDDKKSPLPWKQCALDSFSSFREVLTFCGLAKTEQQMKKQFWPLLRSIVFSPNPPNEIKLILKLREQNVDELCAKALEEYPFARREIGEIAALYNHFKRDAELFCFFAIRLVTKVWDETAHIMDADFLELIERTKNTFERYEEISLADYPITEALYMIARSVGGGEFSQLAREAIT